MTKSACCGNCRFFRRDQDTTPSGDCRRRAPTTIVEYQTYNYGGAPGAIRTNIYDAWPHCREIDWCGEWEDLEQGLT